MKDKSPHRKEILEELDSLSPLLKQFKEQQTGAPQVNDVPSQYFEDLPSVLWNEIQAEQAPSKSVATPARVTWGGWLTQQLQSLFTPQLAIGFAVVLVLTVAWFAFLKPHQNTPLLADQNEIPGIQELPEEQLYEYVMTHIEDYDTEDLLEAAGSIPLEFVWPDFEDEEQLEEVMEELLEELDDVDLSDFM